MKIGRNQPCPCGSGKKYKKCCAVKQRVVSSKVANSNLQVLFNVTGELFHPVRLYYKILNKQGLLNAFHKMKCMDTDTKNKRWVWLYSQEAKNLTFGKPYHEIPSHLQPIVIGSFFQSNEQDDEMFLDVRSIERAEQAVAFFDKFIDRSYTEITHVSVTYRFIKQDPKNIEIRFDSYFTPISVGEIKKRTITEKMKDILTIKDQIKRKEAGLKIIDNFMQDVFPETDKIPLFYYEDPGQLVLALRISVLVATERMKGNENVTHKDIMEKLFS
jgi:hypothetical protein